MFSAIVSNSLSSEPQETQGTPSWVATFMEVTVVIAVIGIAIAFFLSNSLALIAFVILAGVAGLGAWIFHEEEVLKEVDKDIAIAADTVLNLQAAQKTTASKQKELTAAVSLIKNQKICSSCVIYQKEIQQLNTKLLAIENRLKQMVGSNSHH